jgi:uncharacterized protein
MTNLLEERMALISALAAKSPQSHLGRTAVMKLLYFLQTLRRVPLGYRFTLYSYGPFDSDVLADLETAESLGVVESRVVGYSGGYGYQIKEGRNARWLQDRASEFLSDYDEDITWVSRQFGGLSSARLELVSAIIYVDREEDFSFSEIVQTVKEIKPHFSVEEIERFAQSLETDGLIRAGG